jgi:hypothetical protein
MIFGVLGVLGLIPALNTVFGLMPLYGPDVWLHLATAAVAAFVGWRQATGERRTVNTERRRASRAPIANERRQGMYDRRRSAYISQA